MRKTIDVKSVIDYGNYQLSRTDDFATKEYKAGICAMLESILHMTDNYSGFMFLDNNDSEVFSLGYYSRRYFTNHKLLK